MHHGLLPALVAGLLIAPPSSVAQISAAYIGVASAWDDQPTSSALRAAKPAGVETRGYAGLSCDASDGGKLVNCRVTYAEPAGEGFDTAALSLVPQFRLRPDAVQIAEQTHSKVTVILGWPGEGGPCLPPNCTQEQLPPPSAR